MTYLQSGKNSHFITQAQGARQNERDLLMNMNREVISQAGVEVYYICNKYVNVDSIFGEDRKPILDNAKKIVMYVKDATAGIQGNAVYTKFGYSNEHTMDFILSVKEWKEVFPVADGNSTRPLEGDLIYIPRWSEFGGTDFWKITFCDKYDANGFFPLGDHYAFTISTEKWSYSSEHIVTGIAEIDAQEQESSADITVNDNMQGLPDAQNDVIETKADSILDWSESNPFGNG